MTILQLLAGLALLLVGGEALVRGSVAVARRLGLSSLLIGLTLVGFGTSTPELVASLQAALSGSPAIATGNVIGSNIANTLLILGAAALLSPFPLSPASFRRDVAVLACVTVLMTGLVVFGEVGRMSGAILIVLLAAYTVYAYVSERRFYRAAAIVHEQSVEEVAPPVMGTAAGLAVAVAGIAAVLLGAKLLVGAAIVLARQANISEAVIGVTLVAVGTSLPELATSIVAAVRGHSQVAYGNVVGSNVFNILGIGGVTAVVTPITVPAEFVRFDVWVMAASVAALAVAGFTAGKLSRRTGAVFVGAYVVYILAVL